MDPCGLKFQVIRTNGSQVIAVGSWAENIGIFLKFCLQFPVRLIHYLPAVLSIDFRDYYHFTPIPSLKPMFFLF